VIWLWWYAEEAINTNNVWRERAAISANNLLRRAFATDNGQIVWWRELGTGLRRNICTNVPPQPPFFNSCSTAPF
jgi:hypothetical protein